MKTKSSMMVAAILLVVLTMGNAVVELGRYYGLANLGLAAPGRLSPQTQRLERPGERPLPSRPREFWGNPPGPRTMPGTSNFSWLFMASFSRAARQLTVYWNIGLILASILAGVGLWLQKPWGKVVAVLIVTLLLIPSLPNFLALFSRMRGWILILGNGIKILLATVVLVLLFWPASREREQVSG